MTGTEHYREAEMLLSRAANAEGMAHELGLIGRAKAHALLALFDRIQEIGDQLDTLTRPGKRSRR